MLITLSLALGAFASDSDQLIKDLDHLDCSMIDATIQVYLQRNRAGIASLELLTTQQRKQQAKSYREALDKAESVTAVCEQSRVREIVGGFDTDDVEFLQIAGMFLPVRGTLDFIFQTDPTDPGVYERLLKRLDQLEYAYSRVGRLREPGHQ